jgi:hypothetical protein
MPQREQSLAPNSSVSDDPEANLRSALTLAIRASHRSRAEISELMSERLGRKISLNAVNSWTNRTKTRVRFPAAWVLAFSEAAMNDTLQLALLSPELRTRLKIKKDLESLRCAITVLLVDERKRARAKNNGGGRRPHAKQGRRKQ